MIYRSLRLTPLCALAAFAVRPSLASGDAAPAVEKPALSAAISAPAPVSVPAAAPAQATAEDRTLAVLPIVSPDSPAPIELVACHQVIAPDINLVICRLKVNAEKGLKGYNATFEFTDDAGGKDENGTSSTTDTAWAAGSIQKFKHDAGNEASMDALIAAGITPPPMKPKRYVSVRLVLKGYLDHKSKKHGEMPDPVRLNIPGFK